MGFSFPPDKENLIPAQQLTVGIMGGLGPEATLDFFAKILAATPARQDQDHLHLIIDNNPKVPNRHAAIEGSGEDAAPALVQMATRLEAAGADFVVMACNTAHAFQPEIERALTIPFIGLIDEVTAHLKRQQGDSGGAIGLMAAEGCLAANLYQPALADAGFAVVLWNKQELATFMDLVYRIKAGERGQDITDALKSLAQVLIDRDARCLLAACTEIPLFLSQEDFHCTFVSSTDILVEQTIAYARMKIPLPGKP